MAGLIGRRERYRGCLLGGAIGDSRAGGQTSEETRQTLFTAEGLVRAHQRLLDSHRVDPVPIVYRAWRRWLETHTQAGPPLQANGYLAGLTEMYGPQEPDQTTTMSLRTGLMGTVERPINNSRTFGAVIAIAPAGLTPWDPYELARDLAAITHAHPDAYHSAGLFGLTIAGLVDGHPVHRAVENALKRVWDIEGAEDVCEVVHAAAEAAESAEASIEGLAGLGQGSSAPEVVAAAVYSAAEAESLEEGLAIAVTHRGRPDAVASLTGQLLGAAHGLAGVTAGVIDALILKAAAIQVADDLYAHFGAEAEATEG